ncbi:SDR family oxidoreductase [Rhizobiaceae bacterium n13]|uniref:SDR family oxidoreductase n=1 Tax=Ferirhizobium litorale TaxID=2927786 RepID=A0AAE3U314_9HYPH|nr:SDR family oxidoreductase [Fererhizobium litorale]MDI7863754.1 SDR family oxidoreductase [Fererhizobium litorale]MDI7924146.1 SDR family oxidoreductase [Fererhizobium litorale]
MTRTVFITGASSGIGKASAKLFQASGFNVVATMRNPEAGEELRELPGVLVTSLDVEDEASIKAAVAAGIERFGKIDVLVNNAGYGLYGIFESTPKEKLQQQFAVNVFGVMDVTRAILPHFRQNSAGTIVNVSSGAGMFTLPMISAYCASKFALEGFTESLSYELLSLNIGVKLVIPHGGVAETSFQQRSTSDFARDGTPQEYHPFLQRSIEAFGRMGGALTMTSHDVAKVILEAATDGTSRLRYLVGDDARGFVKARRELADQDYVDHMRGLFT